MRPGSTSWIIATEMSLRDTVSVRMALTGAGGGVGWSDARWGTGSKNPTTMAAAMADVLTRKPAMMSVMVSFLWLGMVDSLHGSGDGFNVLAKFR
jgi:hypothetical protein